MRRTLVVTLSRSVSYLGGDVERRAVLEQDGRDLLVTFLRRDVQGRVEVVGGGVDGGAVLQQQQDVVDAAEARGDVQRRLLLLKFTNGLVLLQILSCSVYTPGGTADSVI